MKGRVLPRRRRSTMALIADLEKRHELLNNKENCDQGENEALCTEGGARGGRNVTWAQSKESVSDEGRGQKEVLLITGFTLFISSFTSL